MGDPRVGAAGDGGDRAAVGAPLRAADPGWLWGPPAQPATNRVVGYQSGAARPRPMGSDAQTLVRGLLAGLARGSTVPSETVQALRTLTRARRDFIQTRTAARQRLHDELVVLFPEFVRFLPSLPGRPDLGSLSGARAAGHVQLRAGSGAGPARRAQGHPGPPEWRTWGQDEAQALQALAQRSPASPGRSLSAAWWPVCFAQQVSELAVHVAEVEAAIADLLRSDADGRRLQSIPGIGPLGAATSARNWGMSRALRAVEEVVAYAGLDPRTHQSGAFVGQNTSQAGTRRLAPCALLAAFVAARCAPEWRERYRRLLDRGRAKKEAFTILARALLRVIYHLLRTGEAYDPAHLNSPCRRRQPCLDIQYELFSVVFTLWLSTMPALGVRRPAGAHAQPLA